MNGARTEHVRKAEHLTGSKGIIYATKDQYRYAVGAEQKLAIKQDLHRGPGYYEIDPIYDSKFAGPTTVRRIPDPPRQGGGREWLWEGKVPRKELGEFVALPYEPSFPRFEFGALGVLGLDGVGRSKRLVTAAEAAARDTALVPSPEGTAADPDWSAYALVAE